MSGSESWLTATTRSDEPIGTASGGSVTEDNRRLTDFCAQLPDGSEECLDRYAGQVVLVVNTATNCGLSGQFRALQQLYERYADAGFIILAFPCSQFGNQELDDDQLTVDECRSRWQLTFPIYGRVNVNGTDAHPLFQWLRKQTGGILGDAIKWNFTKFLVDRRGAVQGRYAPTTKPEFIVCDIERELAAS